MNVSSALSVASVDRKKRSNQIWLYCVDPWSVGVQQGTREPLAAPAVAWLVTVHDTGRSCCAAACPGTPVSAETTRSACPTVMGTAIVLLVSLLSATRFPKPS